MADVKCLKDGKFAVTGRPDLPQVSFKKGDELKGILENFADRLVELGFAEVIKIKAKPVKKKLLGKKGKK
jgi:hypothetical protein